MALKESNVRYVTLMTSDDFLSGVQALIKSLQKHSKLSISVMVTQQVNRTTKQAITNLGAGVILVDDIPAPVNESSKDSSWTNSQYTKLNLWKLIEFDQVFYIDADCIVLQNIDEIFDLTTDFAAAPDIFPPDKFNAGVLLVKPNLEIFEKLLVATRTLTSYDGGDTGLLNAFFPDWYSMETRHRLPFTYNAQRTMFHFTRKNPGYWASIQPIKILHFCSSPKPWQPEAMAKGFGELELIWWNAFTGKL